MHREGGMGASSIAKTLKIGRASVYRALESYRPLPSSPSCVLASFLAQCRKGPLRIRPRIHLKPGVRDPRTLPPLMTASVLI